MTQEPGLALASVFQDHMVLQRETSSPIWGKTRPGAEVLIQPSWSRSSIRTRANSAGQWRAKLRTPKAGGPFEITVSGAGSGITLKDVLIGEVWICSGQSNMEWQVKAWPGFKPIKDMDEILTGAAKRPQIRLLQVPNLQSATPQEEMAGKWEVCTTKAVETFSAVGYMFGRNLQDALNVPIGLIDATWGGTEVELWTSKEALQSDPEMGPSLAKKLSEYESLSEKEMERDKRLAEDLARSDWFSDSGQENWKPIVGEPTFEALVNKDFNGSLWYRTKIHLSSTQANMPAILHLGPIDDEDITYVNGREVGRTAKWDEERKYEIPPGLLRAGENIIVVRAVDTGGGGGFSKIDAQRIELAGSRHDLKDWSYRVGADITGLPIRGSGLKACTLYNGMISPIIPFAIRGAIWYQGESNVGRAYQYRRSFPLMIRDWRKRWDMGNFPFYFVQIAPFQYQAQGRSAELREAQALTAQNVPNTGMAVTVDLVDNLADIHPLNKTDVADRLSRIALRRTYGMSRIADRGPTYKSMHAEQNKVRIRFTEATGLHIRGETLQGIEVAGPDLAFRPAHAKVEKETLVVWAEGVDQPVAVRFGWGDAIVTNLYNGAGLPAGGFRTDDWPLLTQNVRW